jgi:hypothetical protein
MFASIAFNNVVVAEKDFAASSPDKVIIGTPLRQAGVRKTEKGIKNGIASIPILT